MNPLEGEVATGRRSAPSNAPTRGSERIRQHGDLSREPLADGNPLAGTGFALKFVVQFGSAAEPAVGVEAFEPEDDEFAELVKFAFPHPCVVVEHDDPIVPARVRV